MTRMNDIQEVRLAEALRRRHRSTVDLTVDKSWLEEISGSPKDLLWRMRRDGLAHRIQGGRYVVNLDGTPSRRPRLKALDLLPQAILNRLNHEHFLSWHTALWYHGLIDQQASRVLVALKTTRKRPARVGIYDVRFVTLTDDRFFGFEPVPGAEGQLPMAHIERALIDSFDRPELAAPTEVVANAMLRAWNRGELDVERLIEYTLRFDSKAVTRRVGFFLDLYEIPGSDALLAAIGWKSGTPLAPGLERAANAPLNPRWKVYEDPKIVENARSLK